MTRQSQLLIKAIRAVEKVLDAQSTDIEELSRIGSDASGIPVERILFGIDLTGIDLRHRDVGFLLDKHTRFAGANLTSEQRRAFNKFSREGVRSRTKEKIRTIRSSMIASFVEAYQSLETPIVSRADEIPLSSNRLRAILSFDLHNAPGTDPVSDPEYCAWVLEQLADWVSTDNLVFFAKLFMLLGDLKCTVGSDAVSAIDDSYYPVLEISLGLLISALPNAALEIYWLTGRSSFHTLEHAVLLSGIRPIHASAVEAALDVIDITDRKMALLVQVNFDCDTDQAERIAARITRERWPASETRSLLDAKVHPKIRSALFRQLLRQGQEGRIIEILKWLDDDKGAVGALSLEDALVHVQSFDVGIRFAEEVGSRMKENQLHVVFHALGSLAGSEADRARLKRLRTRLGFPPT